MLVRKNKPAWIDIFLGVHYRLGTMLSRESVKTRMEGGADDGGMSFTEFSYQIF